MSKILLQIGQATPMKLITHTPVPTALLEQKGRRITMPVGTRMLRTGGRYINAGLVRLGHARRQPYHAALDYHQGYP